MRAFLSFAVVSLLVSGCGGPVSGLKAEALATKRFTKYCSDFSLSAADFEGPVSTSTGGVAFAYEWRKKEKKTERVVVGVMSDGITEIAFPGR